MKNLFDYATKELSQDAFLRWLFENYNCENESVKTACRKLFDSFTENKFKEKTITDLTTVAQWKNIDISIWFKIDGIEQLIVIEDKTGSEIHDDQLARYEKEIIGHNNFWRNEENRKKYGGELYIEKSGNVFKVFYKTLLPFTVTLNLAPKTAAALLDISILPRKISKYSNIEQMLSSISSFNVIVICSLSTITSASVTA